MQVAASDGLRCHIAVAHDAAVVVQFASPDEEPVMPRISNQWAARIFSLVTAGSTPLLGGCKTRLWELVALPQPPDGSTVDLAPVEDLAQSDDLQPPVDMAGDLAPTIRRPFLVGSSLRAAAPADTDAWLHPFAAAEGLDDATERALAAAWLKDALEEHASVAAFARFSLLGLAAGAPPELIAASQRASLDEIRHARICFGLARRYGASGAGPGLLPIEGAFKSVSLASLVKLTAEEGCVGETLGALLAAEQADTAVDAEVKRALTGIARDERRHAELAWRFVASARDAGGPAIVECAVEAIAGAVQRTRSAVIRPLAVDASLWHAHGRLSCQESQAVAERGITDIVLPAAERLCA